MFSLPFSNMKGGTSIIRNARLEVSSVPCWMSLEPKTSFLGPADIYPGETMTFSADYVINDKLPAGKAEGNIALSIVTDSPQFVPSGVTWRFKTDNGFYTMRGDCVDNTGVFCGEYTSPDTTPPVTTPAFDGDSFEGPDGTIYIGTDTIVRLESHDEYVSNSVITRVRETRYSLQPAASFDDLKAGDPPPLSPGPHLLYFASVDNAGNKEAVHTSTISVGKMPPDVGAAGEGGWLVKFKRYCRDKWRSVAAKTARTAARPSAAPATAPGPELPPAKEDTFAGDPLYFSCERALSGPPETSAWKVCAGNTPASPGSGSGAAVLLQSFVPDCDSVEAVRLKIGDGRGWGVLDIMEAGVDGLPGRILARTALNWTGCGIGVYGPTTFPVRKTPLTRGQKYFIRYRHGNGSISFGFTEDNAYKAGDYSGGGPGWDLEFQLLSGKGQAPYLRQAAVGTGCESQLRRLAASEDFRSQEAALRLDKSCGDIKLSSSPAAPPAGSVDWVVGRLLSYKSEVKAEGLNAFWSLKQKEDKDKVVLALYHYIDDGDGNIRDSARGALKNLGGETKILLPRLMERFRKNGADLDLIAAMRTAAAPAVPELIGKLKQTGSLEVADALTHIATEETFALLADFYIAHMRAELRKLSADSIDMRVPENLPQGCIIRELLPESVRNAAGNMVLDGVSFGVYDEPLNDRELISFDIWQAGKLLKNVVTLRKGEYLVLAGCGFESSIAEEMRRKLGIDARPAVLRDGCLPRGEYPENIQTLVPKSDGYSGIETYRGTSREACDASKGCKLFSKHDFEQFAGVEIIYYTEEALFALTACRLESDFSALAEKARQEAKSKSE